MPKDMLMAKLMNACCHIKRAGNLNRNNNGKSRQLARNAFIKGKVG
jgi:hypothetical protein